MYIGIAICCYKGHIVALQRLLDSIQQQTRLPDRVVVSCSSSTDTDISFALDAYSFPLHIITHTEYKNAAQNRNIAALHLLKHGIDVLSFFDADDVMHPQRVEIIHDCFSKYDIKLLLHNLILGTSCTFETYSKYVYHFNNLDRCPWGSTVFKRKSEGLGICNSHVTVYADVFHTIQFDESVEAQAREDTIFATSVIVAYPYQTAYCPYPLSLYYPSGSNNAQK